MHLQYYDSLPHHYCVQPLDHFSASRAQWSLLAAVATDSNHMQKKKKSDRLLVLVHQSTSMQSALPIRGSILSQSLLKQLRSSVNLVD